MEGSEVLAVVAIVVAGLSAWFTHLQAKASMRSADAADRSAEASDRSAGAAEQSAVEAGRTRMEQGAPKVVCLSAVAAWPPMLYSGPHNHPLRDPAVESRSTLTPQDRVVLPRHERCSVYFTGEATLVNEGQSSARVAIHAPVLDQGRLIDEPFILGVGESVSFSYLLVAPVSSWVSADPGEYASALQIVAQDLRSDGPIDAIWLTTGARPLIQAHDEPPGTFRLDETQATIDERHGARTAVGVWGPVRRHRWPTYEPFIEPWKVEATSGD